MPEREGRETAHERIVRALRDRIEREEWSPATVIPSEADLCREFGVARGTIRGALKALENANLIITVPARGRYVRGNEEEASDLMPARRAQDIAEELREELASGIPAPGERFLSEAELMKRFGVSRYTAKRALSELAGAGILESAHGKGHFVAVPGAEC